MNTIYSNRTRPIKVFKVFILIIITVCFAVLYPSLLSTMYKQNYIVNSIAIIIILLMLFNTVSKNGLDVFEPIYFISLIYVMMYFVTPIYDILTGNILWFGYNLFPYGVKSSLFALSGYIVFYIFYSFSIKKRCGTHVITWVKTDENTPYSVPSTVQGEYSNNSLLVPFILIMYAISFLANVWYLLHSGYSSLTYILTLGLVGSNQSSASVMDSIGFVSMLSYSLPTTVFLYWEYGKSKPLKIILFIPALILQVTRGFRFLVIQIVVTAFAYYYLKRHKRPKIKSMVAAFIVIIIPVLIMTLFRTEIRSGSGIDMSAITYDSIQSGFEATFWDNLRVYQNFYGMVGAIPSQFSYCGLRQILIGTLIMMIPRIIWPGKISTGAGIGLDKIIGSNLIGTGQAYPNIGEYYFAFGIFGVILFMALYGWWMKRIKIKYMSVRAGGLKNITFAVLLGTNLQLIIRGYTPSNFWYIVFAILPVVLAKLFVERICNYNAKRDS